MKTSRGALHLLFVLILAGLAFASHAADPLFFVTTAEGDTVFAVYPSGIKVRNASGEDIFIADRDSVRIYVDEDAMRTSRGSFAIGGIGSATREPATEYFRVTPDSVRVYLKENNTRTSRGGFAIGGVASATRPMGNHFFNLENSHSPEIIDPSEARMLWYPYKEAFRVGHVLIDSPDSVGTNSIATGYESKAIGDYSQALGYQARAYADYSTAIGLHANALGESSFAYGDLAEANGIGSFAFGSVARDTLGNVIYGANPTRTNGHYSFAMGMGAQTGGICSMAIGFNAYSETNNSLAIGRNSSATGNNSVAIGYAADASEYNALAIGHYANASGPYSAAFGYSSDAIGEYSMAFGRNSSAEGNNATAIGCYTNADGDYSVALGRETTSGDYGTASGSHSDASGMYSVALGRQNVASGEYAVALGGYSEAIGDYSTVSGRQSSARGDYAVSLGGFNSADSSYSVAIGYNAMAQNKYAVALGYYAIASGLYGSSIGCHNTASGDYSFSTGYYNESNGIYSFTAGRDCVANMNAAVAMGESCEAQDAWTVALGYHTTANGQHSIAIGDGAEALQSHAIAIGEDVTADGMNSVAIGRRASNGGYYGSFVFGDYSSTNTVINDDFNQFKVRASGGYVLHTNSGLEEAKTVYIEENDGSLGLGTSSPLHKLHVVDTVSNTTGTDGALIDIYNPTSGTGAMSGIRFKSGSTTTAYKGGIFYNTTTTYDRGNMVFALANNIYSTNVDRDDARMVLYYNGNVGIGTPESEIPSAKLSVNGHVRPYADASSDLGGSSQRWRYVYASYGTILTSDRRMKTDITPLRYGLASVMKLRPVSFKWKNDEAEGTQLGLIAQEAQEVIPEVVKVGDDEDQTMGMNYTELIPVLVNAIQEQQKQLDEVRKEVELLKQQLAEEKSRTSHDVASSN